MDKLALIKQKYGYVSSSNTNCNSQPIVGKENSTVKKTESQKKENQYNIYKTPVGRPEPAQSPNTKLISQFCPPLPSKAPQTSFSSNSQRQPLKEVKPNQDEKVSINQSIVKSYEKTYDLLKNYRNRIVLDSEQDKVQHQKKLILGKNTLQTHQDIQNQGRSFEKSQKQAKETFIASQVSQRMEKRSYPKRCSPLEGIDIKGSCNVYAQIDNISRLQSRIKQLVEKRVIR